MIYKNINQDSILFRLSNICQKIESGDYAREDLISDIYMEINRLLDISTLYGFDENLWHNYLAFILAMTENPFTLVSEKVGVNEGTVNKLARNDFGIFKQLFDYDFSKIEKELDIYCFTIITDYDAVVKSEQIFNKSVSEKVQKLSYAIEQAKDGDDVYEIVTDFYRVYGVGEFGLNKAFRISNGDKSGISTGDKSGISTGDNLEYQLEISQESFAPSPPLVICCWMIWWVMNLKRKNWCRIQRRSLKDAKQIMFFSMVMQVLVNLQA
jgi:hypothetical protein